MAVPERFGQQGEEVLRVRLVPEAIAVFERGTEFPLSLKEKLGRSRILMSPNSNGLRNHRVKRQQGIKNKHLGTYLYSIHCGKLRYLGVKNNNQ
ncbi:hypothetical protein AVEN_272619-1 [Araneus ventricosus]|uniref:Uncharacterized protein n=1 Tax=Araneus ventricosus TaxID=182803 RepID=A0A4Y2P8J9_ARAVE|nr:hypothetical protein AVEN_272619-1 [Araneus ventricosus]